jgi:hypothetical protein
VHRYRPRTEGLFARTEKWVKCRGPDDRDVHRRTTSKDNVTSIYGKTPAARIVDPVSRSDPAKRHRVYEWLLQESFDDRGNHTFYEYTRDTPDLSVGEIFEHNREYAQIYLRRVLYGNTLQQVGPARRGVDQEHQLDEWERRYLFEVVFDDGDLDAVGDPYISPASTQEMLARTCPTRPDRPDPPGPARHDRLESHPA